MNSSTTCKTIITFIEQTHIKLSSRINKILTQHLSYDFSHQLSYSYLHLYMFQYQ